MKCALLCCYITIRSLHDHIICSIDKEDADLQEKQLWMEYVKHYRRYTVLHIILVFEICQTLNFEQMIHRVTGSWKLAPYMYQYVDCSMC